MNVKYAAITLGLIQLITITASCGPKMPPARHNLTKFYENELNLMAQHFCPHAKNLSLKLLQDEHIQGSASPRMKTFKNNINEFLNNYQYYERFKLFTFLLEVFNTTIENYYYQQPLNDNKNVQYIYKLLKDQGIDDIYNSYEQNFTDFIEQKFLDKFEEYKLQLSPLELQEKPEILQVFQKLKGCQDYKCFNNNFILLTQIIETSEEYLLLYYFECFKKLRFFQLIALKDITKSILKDDRLSQLKPSLKANLEYDIANFVKMFESYNPSDTYEYVLPDIIKTYYNNNDINAEDRHLLVEIFESNVPVDIRSKYDLKVNKFYKQLLKKTKERKAAQSPEILEMEIKFWISARKSNKEIKNKLKQKYNFYDSF